MAKRFTDTEKWEDEWFTDLSNDYKVIWFYLLDTCDNAGVWKKNIKKLNYLCNTNVSTDDLLKVFSKRITILADEKWFINKFCIVQYGHDFLQSKNKAVLSAVKKLIIEGVLVDNGYSIDTLSIPYQYSIDTPKEQVKDIDKATDKAKAIVLDSDTNTVLSYGVAYKLYQQLLNYELPVSEYSEIYDDISEIGWDTFFNTLNLSAADKLKLDEVMTIKLI
jgi:hypothetical protein